MAENITNKALVETAGLKMYFWPTGWLSGIKAGVIRAVDGVTLTIQPGESVGLVGESGSGKSTFGKCILRIHEPTGGKVFFDGQDITHLPHAKMGPFHKQMQMVFQNPFSSLDPRMRIKDVVAEPVRLQKEYHGRAVDDRVRELLSLVGLGWDIAYRLPHELSGGQRQRIAIARALALNPKLVILDEPTSSLDVSVQAQILNLVVDLQQSLGFSYLFISHDLAVIQHSCERVAVMYLGIIMESGSREHIFENPLHPYTKALLSANPEPDPDYQGEEIILQGDILGTEVTRGICRFAPRCFTQMSKCFEENEPVLREIEKGHFVACHLYSL